jgi:hypothetical protein
MPEEVSPEVSETPTTSMKNFVPFWVKVEGPNQECKCPSPSPVLCPLPPFIHSTRVST